MSDPLVERWSGVLEGLAASEREDLVAERDTLKARVAELEARLAEECERSLSFSVTIGIQHEALQAELKGKDDAYALYWASVRGLEDAVLSEREACAKLIEGDLHGNERLAAAIHARGAR